MAPNLGRVWCLTLRSVSQDSLTSRVAPQIHSQKSVLHVGINLLTYGPTDTAEKTEASCGMQEFWMGVPASMCESAASNGSSNGRREQERFPQPRCPLPSEPHDITFSSVEGDFQVRYCYL